MASKKNDQFGAIFILVTSVVVPFVIYIFGVLFLVLYITTKVVVTILFYLFILIAAVIYVASRQVQDQPPPLPNPEDYDPVAETNEIQNLIRLRNSWQKERQLQYTLGHQNGINLTKASEETRFDVRSKLGRELNINIDRLENSLINADADIQLLRASGRCDIPNWRSEFDQWAKLRSTNLSWRNAIAVFLITIVLFFFLRSSYVNEFIFLQGMLLWDPFPSASVGPLVGAVLVACLVFGLAFHVHQSRLPKLLEGMGASSWHALEAKWSPDTDIDNFFSAGRSSPFNKSPPADEESSPDWCDILGVAAGSSPTEIRSAYLSAIKSYHSDRVAELGPKLRALAEEESKKINRAYDEARKHKGFR